MAKRNVVSVCFSEREVAELNRQRGQLSKSAYIRKLLEDVRSDRLRKLFKRQISDLPEETSDLPEEGIILKPGERATISMADWESSNLEGHAKGVSVVSKPLPDVSVKPLFVFLCIAIIIVLLILA